MCKIREMNLETAKYYGYEAQSNQLVEECAELIQAVNKYRRVETGLGQPVAEDKKAIARDNLVKEIADVELMLEQVKYLLQIPEDELLAVKTFKVNRTRERAECCDTGFHACEYPLDCFGYYDPAHSVFHEVELSGEMDKSGDNTKVCATDIKIGARLSIAGLVKMAIDFTMSKVNKEAGSDERHGFASATGNCGASSATRFCICYRGLWSLICYRGLWSLIC